jgi:hypothetical protein
MNLFTVLLPYLVLIGTIFLFKPLNGASKYFSLVTVNALFLRVQRGAEYLRGCKEGNPNHVVAGIFFRFIFFGLFIVIIIIAHLYIQRNI